MTKFWKKMQLVLEYLEKLPISFPIQGIIFTDLHLELTENEINQAELTGEKREASQYKKSYT